MCNSKTYWWSYIPFMYSHMSNLFCWVYDFIFLHFHPSSTLNVPYTQLEENNNFALSDGSNQLSKLELLFYAKVTLIYQRLTNHFSRVGKRIKQAYITNENSDLCLINL